MVIHGDVMLDSEVPKQCFAQVYQENPNQEHFVDYFECKQCVRIGQPLKCRYRLSASSLSLSLDRSASFSGICRSCASVCHKGSEIVLEASTSS